VNFKQWLLEGERPGTKFGLYPPGYAGTGVYPPCDWMPEAGEAITYAPKAWLDYKFLPGFKPPAKANHYGLKYNAVQYKIPPDTSTNNDN